MRTIYVRTSRPEAWDDAKTQLDELADDLGIDPSDVRRFKATIEFIEPEDHAGSRLETLGAEANDTVERSPDDIIETMESEIEKAASSRGGPDPVASQYLQEDGLYECICGETFESSSSLGGHGRWCARFRDAEGLGPVPASVASEPEQATESTNGGYTDLSEEDRSLTEISAGSAPHEMLSILGQLEARDRTDNGYTSADVSEHTIDHGLAPRGASSSLGNLYRWRLVEREKRTPESGSGREYHYTINAHGWDELERVGFYEPHGAQEQNPDSIQWKDDATN